MAVPLRRGRGITGCAIKEKIFLRQSSDCHNVREGGGELMALALKKNFPRRYSQIFHIGIHYT